MRPRLLFAALLCAAVVARAGAAPQADVLGTLGGQVLGSDGKPVDGARVTLQASEGKRPQTTETTSQGRFWFPSLPSGLYDVRAYSKGRSSEWRKKVWIEPGRQTNVTMRLRPKKAASSMSLRQDRVNSPHKLDSP